MLLATFDLDFTIWRPEMYQLQGPPKLVSVNDFEGRKTRRKGRSFVVPSLSLKGSSTIHVNKIATDRVGTPISVFDGAAHALSEINRMKKEGHPMKAAISSRTDEPSWARQCMQWLIADDGTPLSECFDYIEISYDDKSRHFESLSRKTGIAYDDMCFFDNEHRNIVSVSQLGVKCIYTPDGMTKDAWNEALRHFNLM